VRAIAKNYSMGQFRYTVWDPWTIVSQILTLQAIFYLFLGIWIAVFCLMSDSPRSLDQIFSYTELNPNKVGGKLLIAAFFFNALNCSLGLWYIVQRTKLCLDFTATVHLLHLVCCTWYNGSLPLSATWWAINLVCVTTMCVTGEFLCMRTELSTIPVSMAGAGKSDV